MAEPGKPDTIGESLSLIEQIDALAGPRSYLVRRDRNVYAVKGGFRLFRAPSHWTEQDIAKVVTMLRFYFLWGDQVGQERFARKIALFTGAESKKWKRIRSSGR